MEARLVRSSLLLRSKSRSVKPFFVFAVDGFDCAFLVASLVASFTASTISAFFRIRLPLISNFFFEISTSSILISLALIFTAPLMFKGSGLLISLSLSSTLPGISTGSPATTISFVFGAMELAVVP